MLSFFGVCNDTIDNLDFCFGVVNCTSDAIGDAFVTSNDIKDTELCFRVEALDNDKNWDWKALVVSLFGVFCVFNTKLILISGSLVLFFWYIDSLFIFIDSCFGVVSNVEYSFVLSLFFSVLKK